MLHLLTNDESAHVLNLLRLDAQKTRNEGKPIDGLTLTAMAKIADDVQQHFDSVEALLGAL